MDGLKQAEDDEVAALLAEAREVDREVCELVRRRCQDKARLADRLLRIKERRLYVALGFADLGSYAKARGITNSARHAKELVWMVEKLAELPAVAADFRDGRSHWTKVRVAARYATPETDARWAADLRLKSRAALMEQGAAERGELEPDEVELRITLSRGQRARFEATVLRMSKDHERELTTGEVLELLCIGAPANGAAPHAQLVLHRCECGTTTIETPRGPVEAPQPVVDEALCHAEVVDARGAPRRATKTVPPKVARHVRARDRGRCRVPGCGNMGYIHQHHEPDRAAGHDPDRMLLLCAAHHRARHEGQLVIRGVHPVFRFFLVDGTEIPPASREARCRKAAGEVPTSREASPAA